MTVKDAPEFVKPSRLRVKVKGEKEEHIKNRIPKHTPYKRTPKNIKTDLMKRSEDIEGYDEYDFT